MPDASEYRDRAAECQRLADAAANEIDRTAWLKLAQSWLILLNHHENGTIPPGDSYTQPGHDEWPESGRS